MIFILSKDILHTPYDIEVTFFFPDKHLPIAEQQTTACFFKHYTGERTPLNRKIYERDATGVAICSPKDKFEKRKGRKIAFTYALTEFSSDKKVRKLCWNEFIKTFGI